MTALWQSTATELVAGFRARQWSPKEALDSVLERLEAINPALNAVIALTGDAQEAAEKSGLRYIEGRPLSPLDGVPISIKDNLLLAGVPATWGTAALRDWIPDRDELPVARLRQAGAVLFAKTNAPEFTLEGYTDNPVYGVTGSPWAPALTPGGSSGGAAAAVAAGIGPLALGTDGGGSIRRPAAHCGLVGLKPSIGTVPRADGFPQILLDFEVAGPLARCVEDAALMLNVLEGACLEDRQSWMEHSGRRTTASRVLCVSSLPGCPVDPQIRRHVEKAATTFSRMGLEVVFDTLPLELAALNKIWSEVGQIGLAHLAETHPTWLEHASPKYQDMANAGARLPASRLWHTLDVVSCLRRQVDTLFTSTDMLLMPSIAALSWPASQAYPPTIDGQPVGPRGHAVFTGWVNAAGNPAINLPVEPSHEGLPIGLQLIGPWQSEHLLLDLAQRYQRLAPWKARYTDLWER
ncbi:MAG: amidase [Gammaproteobacteria bacterium]|nr:amidase [Gammaproteobacteria bacterium]